MIILMIRINLLLRDNCTEITRLLILIFNWKVWIFVKKSIVNFKLPLKIKEMWSCSNPLPFFILSLSCHLMIRFGVHIK